MELFCLLQVAAHGDLNAFTSEIGQFEKKHVSYFNSIVQNILGQDT